MMDYCALRPDRPWKLPGICIAILLASILFACPANAERKTGGNYEIVNDVLDASVKSTSGPAAAGGYTLISAMGQQAGYMDFFQVLNDYFTGYMVESGYISGIEPVFDVFVQTATATAPVAGGYLGAGDDPVPGARITYTVNFSNSGEAAINHLTGAAVGYGNIQVESVLATECEYEAGTIQLDAAVQTDASDFPGTDECHYDSVGRKVVCYIDMPAGSSGTLEYSCIIQ